MTKIKNITSLSAAALIGVCGTTALAQNGGDACASPTLLTLPATPTNGSYMVVATGGDTTNATPTSGTSLNALCGQTAGTNDVWYRVRAAAYGNLKVDLCASDPGFDAVVSIHTGCPVGAASNSISCNDNFCGNLPSTTYSNAVAGTFYLIRVGGHAGSSGTFTLTVTNTPPAPATTAIGPDVTVGNIVDVTRYGTGNSVINGIGTVGMTAYSVGTDSCNRGDFPVLWIDQAGRPGYGPDLHPVIAQNLYRYKTVNGVARFDQVGQSWLKHGFLSTNSTACGNCIQPPFGGDQLGVNCSDTYGSGLNGSQGGLGPRSEVNPATGVFAWPHGTGQSSSSPAYATIGMRAQAPTAGLTGQPAGTRYFTDTHYVTQDDAQYVRPFNRNNPNNPDGSANPDYQVALNGLNNVSFREISASSINSGAPSLSGATNQRNPGIQAWKNIDPAVVLVNADYLEHNVNFFTGMFIRSRFWVGVRTFDRGNGVTNYQYNIYNLNSDRAGGSFTIPCPDGVVPTNFEFNSPYSHSGEPYSNAPWTFDQASNTITFRTQDFATNANANAIRWGTMYSIRFDLAAAPTTGNGSIALFKPGQDGDPTSVAVSGIPVPTLPPPPCLVDFNHDGVINADDLSGFITAYFNTPADAAADFNGDGVINGDDLGDFVTAYFNGC